MAMAMDIDIEELKRQWSIKYPGCTPRAETFKDTYKDRWVRFYTLDEAKRYPENNEEQQTIVGRHNAILSVLNPGSSLLVFTCDWTSSPAPSLSEIERHKNNHEKFLVAFVEDPHETDAELITYRHIYVSLRAWHAGNLDDMFKAVSRDEASGIILAPTDLEWLYHPYDGGIDVIMQSRLSRDKLKNNFKQWS